LLGEGDGQCFSDGRVGWSTGPSIGRRSRGENPNTFAPSIQPFLPDILTSQSLSWLNARLFSALSPQGEKPAIVKALISSSGRRFYDQGLGVAESMIVVVHHRALKTKMVANGRRRRQWIAGGGLFRKCDGVDLRFAFGIASQDLSAHDQSLCDSSLLPFPRPPSSSLRRLSLRNGPGPPTTFHRAPDSR
jgi:hypothetical protein